jgi:hypothetical protein
MMVACVACAFAGVAAAIALRGSTASGKLPAIPQGLAWGASRAATAAPPPIGAPASPAAPAPVVEPIEPEAGAEHSPPAAREGIAGSEAPAAVAPERRRRTATLIVGSSPPGAEIVMNGEALGTAPTRVEVPRYRSVEIQATLAGYLPWKKRVYVRQAETRVGTSLTPLEAETADDGASPAEP